ncbi:MAG: glycosyltransferase [Candidatus Omnitrophota bacterium]|jgi:glycosyltransferase involved in cell wall biosynthesis/MoaA/NifB/PqqE/SkfB family radical SAM enzyme
MDISIVVPTFNRKNKLKSCLESIFAQDYPLERFEIIVVDDGSTDGTKDMVAALKPAFPHLRYYYQENQGPAAARNFGVRQSKADIVGFTDDDCRLSRSWVRAMLASYALEPLADVVGGKTSVDARNIKALVSQSLSDGAIFADIGVEKKIIFFPTCNVSYKKSSVNAEFAQSFCFPAGEDLEFFWRLYKGGSRFVFNKNIAITHNCHMNLRSFIRQAYLYGRGNFRVKYVHQDHPLLKEIKTNNIFCFFGATILNLLKIPRFAYTLGFSLVKKHRIRGFYTRLQVFAFFILHKVVYLLGNFVEYFTVRKMAQPGQSVDCPSITNSLLKPETIILDITHRCNLFCTICDIRKDKPILEYSTQEVKDLIVQAIDWGVHDFVLSGGEALMRKDILSILDFVKEKKYCVGLLTNGILLTQDFLRVLLPYLTSGSLSLCISLDSLRAAVHDEIRGLPGCFDKTFAGITMLAQQKQVFPNINFNVITIILNENLEELQTIASTVLSLNANSLQFQPLLSNNRILKDRADKVKYWVPRERIPVLDKAIDALVVFKKANPAFMRNSENNLELVKKYFRGSLVNSDIQCHNAAKTMLIAYTGDITTCFDCYGNIRKEPLEQIFHAPAAEQARRKAAGCAAPCLLPCFTD